MSEDYSARQPITEWNSQKKMWQRSTEDQLLELWEPFLEIWPTEGTMQNGKVYELRMQALLTTDSEYSSLPTPTTRDHKDGQADYKRQDKVQVDTISRAVFSSGEILLPTTRVSMKNGASAKEVSEGNPKFRLEAVNNWGRFEAAIRRWEEILGRPAPDPTKPDGKDGAHRLSSAFTEWMMGVPEGWITDCGLTRKEELVACGNGVVPQQAELALRMLIGDDF